LDSNFTILKPNWFVKNIATIKSQFSATNFEPMLTEVLIICNWIKFARCLGTVRFVFRKIFRKHID
jgi:hypothetical protein